MQACEQAPGLNMLQHGQLVRQHYLALINQLKAGMYDCKELQELWNMKLELVDDSAAERYQVYHDCFKHGVLMHDDAGRRHFPNHALASSQQYALLFPGDTQVTELIRRDMDLHVSRGDDLPRASEDGLLFTLLLTAFAEINANAEMFGGRSSDSYKIKHKRLKKIAKKILSTLNEGDQHDS